MMKIFCNLMFVFLSGMNAYGENSLFGFPESKVDFQLQALTEGLPEDCKEYEKFLQKNHRQADDVAFARSLPLTGQMKDSYEADFILKAVSEHGQVLSVDLKELTYHQQNPGLVALSDFLKLVRTEFKIFKSDSGDLLYIKIMGRDLACDLLNHQSVFMAKAHYLISPPSEEVMKIDRFYSQIAKLTLHTLQMDAENPVKAAVLGLHYGRLLKAERILPADRHKKIAWLFETLFLSETLVPGNSWSVDKSIIYQKSLAHGPVAIVLTVAPL